jgi:hypothetical protein
VKLVKRKYRYGVGKWTPEFDPRARQQWNFDQTDSLQKKAFKVYRTCFTDTLVITVPKTRNVEAMSSNGGDPYEFLRTLAITLRALQDRGEESVEVDFSELHDHLADNSGKSVIKPFDDLVEALVPWVPEAQLKLLSRAFESTLISREELSRLAKQGPAATALGGLLQRAVHDYVVAVNAGRSVPAHEEEIGHRDADEESELCESSNSDSDSIQADYVSPQARYMNRMAAAADGSP